jgi:hypothetical protein
VDPFFLAFVTLGLAMISQESRSRRVEWLIDDVAVAESHLTFDRFGETDRFRLLPVQWLDIDEVFPADVYQRSEDREHLSAEGVGRYEAMFRAGVPVPPVLAYDDADIWDGRHRWNASKNVGIERVPVIEMVYTG